MMRIEIVDATRAHVRELVRCMRDEDRAEIEDLGENVRHTVHRLHRDSIFSRAALIDGAVAAVWGLEGTMLSDEALPWLFTTPTVERAPLTFLRVAQAEAAHMMIGRNRLISRVAASYERSVRLFEMVGFVMGPPTPSPPHGVLYRQMVMTAEPRLPEMFDAVPEQPISTEIALYGGVFVKRHVVPKAGSYVPQHSHSYDHLSLLSAGAMRGWCDGKYLGDFTAPAEIRIPAGAKHTFLTLVDGTTFCCVHSVDRFEEDEEHELPTVRPVKNRSADLDSIVIREERFAEAWRDSEPLRAEHVAEIGPRDGVPLDVNVPIFEKLDQMGMLQTMTVRSNGRVFGYLVTIIGPSLENAQLTVGTQTAFYISQDFRGAGIRLQRASLDALKARVCMKCCSALASAPQVRSWARFFGGLGRTILARCISCN